MPQTVRLLCHSLLVILLTLLTQVGGVAYLLALLAARRWCRADRLRWTRIAFAIAATLLIYAAASFVIVPPIAELLGRIRVPCNPWSAIGCVLNRTYLRPEALALVMKLDRAMNERFPGTRITILEGSFPFLDGFPLPPHLSHDDGRKVDLAFFYRRSANGQRRLEGSPSPVGYFHFEQPRPGDSVPCAGGFTPLRWDFAWLQPNKPAWILDEERTRAMILWLKARPEVVRIFIEPHLAERLGVGGGKVRFQGCQAARHDDHLHVEIR